MLVEGDMIYEDASLGPARLPIGQVNQVLTVVSGKPTWTAATGGSGTQGGTGTGTRGGTGAGTQGVTGTQGVQGPTGGVQGTQGTTGTQGASGGSTTVGSMVTHGCCGIGTNTG